MKELEGRAISLSAEVSLRSGIPVRALSKTPKSENPNSQNKLEAY